MRRKPAFCISDSVIEAIHHSASAQGAGAGPGANPRQIDEFMPATASGLVTRYRPTIMEFEAISEPCQRFADVVRAYDFFFQVAEMLRRGGSRACATGRKKRKILPHSTVRAALGPQMKCNQKADRSAL